MQCFLKFYVFFGIGPYEIKRFWNSPDSSGILLGRGSHQKIQRIAGGLLVENTDYSAPKKSKKKDKLIKVYP